MMKQSTSIFLRFLWISVIQPIILCFFTFQAKSQSDTLTALTQRFINDTKGMIGEKIFVHTDKSFYVSGETMWFKIYVLQEHKPSAMSKVAYVDLIDYDGRLIQQAKIGIKEGEGNGSFLIPGTINTAKVRLMAYTSWMKNFGVASFFQKDISLVNTFRSPDWSSIEKKAAYSIQFFPEGGALVNGIQSTVAFKAIDGYGKSVSCHGAILNGRQDTVAYFETQHFGMGSFAFTPQSGNSYQVKIFDLPQGSTEVNFPDIKNSGMVMHLVDADSSHLTIKVTTTDKNSSQVYLIAHTANKVEQALQQDTRGGEAIFNISVGKLHPGISQLTLFNADRQPMCERLVFKRPPPPLALQVYTDKKEYSSREKVSLSLSAGNNKIPSQASISLAAYRIDSLQPADLGDIYSYFWLQSDLKGTIDSPAYYFENPDTSHNKALDNLLLTQGWRKFEWKQGSGNQAPYFSILPEYEGQIISGRVISKSSLKAAPGIKTFLSIPGERFHFSTAVSDDSGWVHFVVKDAFGQGEMVVTTENNNSYAVEIHTPARNESKGRAPYLNLPQSLSDQLLIHSMASQVEHAFGHDTLGLLLLPAKADTGRFYGHPDKSFLLDDYTRFPSMEEVIREFVTDVRVRKENGTLRLEVMNRPYQTYFNSAPLVLLDGVPIFDMNKIIAFDPLKVKSIDVVAHKYVYENIIANGIVSFSTYQGDLADYELDPGAIVLEYQGLQLQRDFYQPRYDTRDQKQTKSPDNRNVLFWSPQIKVNNTGSGSISFYTSDIPGTYVIMAEGITRNGQAGSGSTFITVKE